MQWERLEKHIISPRNKLTWRSSLKYGTTWSPVPVTIHCFYCHIFKFLFVTNFHFYFHFSFSPWRRFVRFFCFILLFPSSSPCRKDQFAVSYFSTSLIVLIQIYNWEIRYQSLICFCGFADKSPKRVDREGLGKRRTWTRQRLTDDKQAALRE